MSWSTRELAELAGTTVRAVRYYHSAGLLDMPERDANGYKRYEVSHVVRVLRLKRLSELNVPLAEIAGTTADGKQPEHVLRVIDAELKASIEELKRARVELSVILNAGAPADLPDGFSQVGANMTDADRALLLIYSRVYDPAVMTELRDMMSDKTGDDSRDAEFENLPDDTDEATRQHLAEFLAAKIVVEREKHPWLLDPVANAPQGREFAEDILGKSVIALYNRAQLDVLARVDRLINKSALPDVPADA